MIKVGEEPMPVGSKRLGQANDVLDASCEGAGDPGAEELLGGLAIEACPEAPQILLQEICLEERPIEALELLEVSQGRMVKPLSTLEEKKAAALQHSSILGVTVPLVTT